jgi:5-methylcytosine-specific restriction endonuclease McrA
MTFSGLSQPTLVLNKSWQPHNAVTARKALEKCHVERARVLDPESYNLHDIDSWYALKPSPDHRVIVTTRGPIRVPEIIVCTEYNQFPKRTVVFSRKNLWKRDGMRCQYCGKALTGSDVTVDHIIPKSQGGISSFENCVLSCLQCNNKKRDRTPKQAGLQLRRTWIDKTGNVHTQLYGQPKAPRWSPLYSTARITRFPKSWKSFLQFKNDELYWNVELEP